MGLRRISRTSPLSFQAKRHCPLIVPRPVTLIGTAPHRARYSTARVWVLLMSVLIALPSSRQKTEGAAGCPDGQEQPSGSEPAVAYYACSRSGQLPLTPVCHAPVTTCTPFKCKHRPA